MNTLFHLWIEPAVMNRKRFDGKIHVNYIESGTDNLDISMDDADNYISGQIMAAIMYEMGIDSNYNYGVVYAKETQEQAGIYLTESDAEMKERVLFETEMGLVLSGEKELPFTKSNVIINDGGKLEISVPSLKIKDTINFAKVWGILEQRVIGKIQKGDVLTLTDTEGNEVISIRGGSFLNTGIADMNVYDKTLKPNASMYERAEAEKGGLFVRDNGDIDIGDTERTFYMTINTAKLLLAAKRANINLIDFTNTLLIEKA